MHDGLEYPVAAEAETAQMIAAPLLVPLRTHAQFIDTVGECYQGGVARIEPIHFELREIADDQIRRGDPLAALAIGEGRQRARDEFHQCRLAGAVTAEDGQALTGGECDVQVAADLVRADTDGEMASLQNHRRPNR